MMRRPAAIPPSLLLSRGHIAATALLQLPIYIYYLAKTLLPHFSLFTILRRPCIWEVNDRRSYDFLTCMGGILVGRTVRGAYDMKLQHNY